MSDGGAMTDGLLFAVIDAETGTVLSPSNLYLVEAEKDQLDQAESNDSDAHYLAMNEGHSWRIDTDLWFALMTGNLEMVASCMGWQMETDNTGQTMLYCGDGDE